MNFRFLHLAIHELGVPRAKTHGKADLKPFGIKGGLAPMKYSWRMCVINSVTIFGKKDGQKCLIWPGQLASEAFGGLSDTPVCYYPFNTPEVVQATTAHRNVKTGFGRWQQKLCGVQRSVFLDSHLWQSLPSCLGGPQIA